MGFRDVWKWMSEDSKKIHLLSDISKKKHKGCMTVEGKYLVNKFCIGVKEKRVNKSILQKVNKRKRINKSILQKVKQLNKRKRRNKSILQAIEASSWSKQLKGVPIVIKKLDCFCICNIFVVGFSGGHSIIYNRETTPPRFPISEKRTWLLRRKISSIEISSKKVGLPCVIAIFLL